MSGHVIYGTFQHWTIGHAKLLKKIRQHFQVGIDTQLGTDSKSKMEKNWKFLIAVYNPEQRSRYFILVFMINLKEDKYSVSISRIRVTCIV